MGGKCGVTGKKKMGEDDSGRGRRDTEAIGGSRETEIIQCVIGEALNNG